MAFMVLFISCCSTLAQQIQYWWAKWLIAEAFNSASTRNNSSNLFNSLRFVKVIQKYCLMSCTIKQNTCVEIPVALLHRVLLRASCAHSISKSLIINFANFIHSLSSTRTSVIEWKLSNTLARRRCVRALAFSCASRVASMLLVLWGNLCLRARVCESTSNANTSGLNVPQFVFKCQ